MTTTLQITSDLVYDEAISNDATDNDVDSLSTALQDAIDALSLSFYTAPAGFPQHAQVTDFATDTINAATSYFLASNGSGDAFSSSTGVATLLYVGSDQIYLFGTDDPNIVVGRVGNSASGDVALVLALDPSAADPSLGVTVYAPLVHGDGSAVDDADTLDLTDLIYLGENFTTSEPHNFDSFAGVPSGSDAFAMILPDGANTLQLLITGFSGETEQKITISQDANAGSVGGGGTGQHVGPGNSLRIDTISGGDFSKADTPSEDNNPANISYLQHEGTVDASFQLVQINPGSGQATSLNVFAYDVVGDAQGTNYVTNAIASDGATVTIDPANVHIFDALHHEITPATGQITAVSDGNGGFGVHITGLALNYTVEFSTPGDTFDRFIVTNTQPLKGSGSNITFDIGHIHVTTLTTGSGTEVAELGSHIVFEDDGPTVTLSTDTASVTVDETALGTTDSADFSTLFTVDYGADGAGTVAYALGVSAAGANSTLVDTASGHGIFLYTDGSDVVGRVGSDLTTADAGGAIAFRISVDTDGNVQLDQSLAIKHGDTGNDDETVVMTVNSLVTLTATAYDNEGANSDSSSASANIAASFTFHDDGPSITSPIDAAHDFVVAANTNGATGSNNFDIVGGADGLASYVFTGTPDGVGDYTWAWNTDHTVITESYKGSALFTLTLDSSDGSYDMAMLGSLPPSTDHLDTSDIKAGGPGTHYIDVGLMGSGNAIRIDGSPGFINESHAYVGVTNGNFDTGETMTFSMVNSSGTALDFYGMDIGGKSAQGSSYHWVAYDNGSVVASGDTGVIGKNQKATIDPAGDVVVDAIVITKTGGNAIRIDGSPGFINESHAYVGVNNGNFDTGETMTFSMVNSSGTALDFFGMDIGGKSAQGSSYHWVAYDNGSAVASGDTGIIAKGAKATIDPAGDIVVDQIVITKMSGNANKVGLADIDIFLPPVDTGFVYNVQVTDGDGDHHGSSFTAYIDADGGGIDTSTVFLPGLSA